MADESATQMLVQAALCVGKGEHGDAVAEGLLRRALLQENRSDYFLELAADAERQAHYTYVQHGDGGKYQYWMRMVAINMERAERMA